MWRNDFGAMFVQIPLRIAFEALAATGARGRYVRIESMTAPDVPEQFFGPMPLDLVRLTFRAAFWRLLATPARLASMDVLVVSPGGVGTTFLIRHLSRFARTNLPTDADYLKHLPGPPPMPPKTIFIRGDGESIYASIKRRGWVARQGAKLGSVGCVYSRGETQKAAFIAAVRAQEQRWRQSEGEVLFVDYDDIWRRAEDIMTFAGITDPCFITEFPQRQMRLSIALDIQREGANRVKPAVA